MKTLAIVNGDLQLAPSGHAVMSDRQRVAQDLGIALREHFGVDRFHPNWGSVLGDLIGTPIGEATRNQIATEVKRVINNYVAVQEEQVRDLTSGQSEGQQMISREVIVAITDIEVVPAGEQAVEVRDGRIMREFTGSRFDVRITLRTLSGNDFDLNLPVGA